MKILTNDAMDRVDLLLATARALLDEAHGIVAGAHRSSWVRYDLKWALSAVRGAAFQLREGRNSGYLKPPDTPKARRMERMKLFGKSK